MSGYTTPVSIAIRRFRDDVIEYTVTVNERAIRDQTPMACQPEHRLERRRPDGTSFTTHRWPNLTHGDALSRARSVAPAFVSDDQSVHLVWRHPQLTPREIAMWPTDGTGPHLVQTA
jgi:hypothetical protein